MSAIDAEPRSAKFDGEPILIESFESNANDWPTGREETDWVTNEWEISDGVYHWKAESHQGVHWYVHPGMTPETDYHLSVLARQLAGPQGSNYGLVFRVIDSDNFYYFAINPDREFYVVRSRRGEWEEVIGWARSLAIKPGEWNRLGVVADHDQFEFYINDQWVAELEDNTLRRGRVGLSIEIYEGGNEAEFEFDDLELRELPQEGAPGANGTLLDETFDDNAAGWLVGEVSDDAKKGTRQIVDGVYRLETETFKEFSGDSVPIPISPPTNFALTLDATLVEGPPLGDSRTTIWIWMGDDDLSYSLEFHNDGTYAAWETRDADQSTWIQTTTKSSAHDLSPGATNRVSIVVEDSTLTFRINDKVLLSGVSLEAEHLNDIYLGVISKNPGHTTTVEFDNVLLEGR